MFRVAVVPAFMSPVSPTLVTPGPSSSMRSFSPSNDTTGRSPAGVSVRRTTNSWVLDPSFDTENVTGPWGAVAEDRWMYISVGEDSPSATVTALEGWDGAGLGSAASVLHPPGPVDELAVVHAGRKRARPASGMRSARRPRWSEGPRRRSAGAVTGAPHATRACWDCTLLAPDRGADRHTAI